MAVILEAVVQALAGRQSARGAGPVTRAAIVAAPFLILTVVYLLSR